MTTPQRWLQRVRRLDALSRVGAAYASDHYATDRYAELAAITREMADDLGVAVPVPADRAAPVVEAVYPTPRVDVRAVVEDEGRVLLVRERSDGRWTLPGGWVDPGEAPARSAARETAEESGFSVAAVALLGCYDEALWTDPPSLSSILKMVVRCRLLGGEAATSSETDAVAWCTPDEARGLDLSPHRTPPRMLVRALEHLEDRALPTDCD